MTTVDSSGNIHRGAGAPGAGEFTGRIPASPAGTLVEPSHQNPLERRFDTVEEKVRAMQAELTAAVDGLSEDENWGRWLDTICQFHSYSFQNQLLIALQKPEATRVAGFKTWLRLKRPVQKGEKGISILAPRLITKRDEAGANVLDENGRPMKQIVGFTSATVFDISQTSGEDLPTIYRDLSEEPPEGLIDDLTTAIEAQGYSVSFEEIDGGAKGYTTAAGSKRVVIDARQSAGSRATTLAHELGHIMCGHMDPDRKGDYHVGHGGKRGEMEVEAESFAYTLARINGMETHQRNASEYVASWQQHEPDAIRKVGETLSRAIKATMTSNTWRNAL